MTLWDASFCEKHACRESHFSESKSLLSHALFYYVKLNYLLDHHGTGLDGQSDKDRGQTRPR